jgi:hypothetical protein
VAPDRTVIADEAAASDLVVVGDVTAAPTAWALADAPDFTRYRFAVSRLVAAAPGPSAAKALTLVEAVRPSRDFLPPGRYLLFLTRAVDPTEFFATNGVLGILGIAPDGQSLSRLCPNFSDPTHPSSVPSSTMPSLDTVLAQIPRALPGH